jgi:S1-C subfamily serine protease
MHARNFLRLGLAALVLAGVVSTLVLLGVSGRAQDVSPKVLEDEIQRVATIEKIKPAVVAIFSPGGQGGGSGVLIDEEGYALSNFHVVAGTGPVMQCGLADGILYDAVLVGLDKVGDVALIKLLPKKEGDKFPYAKMGDSDKVRQGDWALALGNPFLLATDFTPTVTYGIVSGVNRYQYPANGLLEYTDCIQVDASINPGNSGGPLFNTQGELIGINGRISLEKRGRVNVGVGYAISINQIKNFLGQLRAGLDTDHASLGAVVKGDEEDGSVSRVTVTNILEESDVARRGLAIGDELLKFAGRDVTTVNQFKNIIGIFPRGWRMPLKFRHVDAKNKTQDREVLVRLMGVQRQESRRQLVRDPDQPPDQRRRGGPPPAPPKPPEESPATKLYEEKAGFANYYFNRKARERLLAQFAKQGDFKDLKGKWTWTGTVQFEDRSPVSIEVVLEEKAGEPVVTFTQGGTISFEAKPIGNAPLAKLQVPPDSGGLLMALFQYRQLLTLPDSEKTFQEFHHGGNEPFYTPGPDNAPPDFTKQRRDTEVLRTQLGAYPAKWYFAPDTSQLLGFEVWLDPQQDDPCEVYLSDYKPLDGRQIPHRLAVHYGNKHYGTLTLKQVELK